jgi:hypothetical protein
MKTVRIIIFGGSTTAGVDASGCCCSYNDDSRGSCPKSSLCGNFCSGNGCTTSRDGPGCSWTAHIRNFIKSWVSHDNNMDVEFYDFSKAGTSTGWAMDKLIMNDKSIFHDNNKQPIKLTSDDIVFLDYSTNDAHLYTASLLDEMTLKIGLESFIRLLYESSINYSINENTNDNNKPLIILLEHWPFVNGSMYDVPPHPHVIDYSNTYREIAQYYHIPIWSYRDIVWTDNREYLHVFLNFNSFPKWTNAGWLHARWPLHLFYADVIAAAMVEKARICKLYHQNETVDISKEYKFPLPTRRYHSDANNVNRFHYRCDYQHTYGTYNAVHEIKSNNHNKNILKFHYKNDNGHNNYKHGCFHLKHEGDRTTSPGWITTTYTSIISDGITTTNNTITSDSCKISFNFKTPIEWLDHIKNKKHLNNNNNNKDNTNSIMIEFLLQIEYLRTYENGGLADIYICNEKITQLDTLWENTNTSRYSIKTSFVNAIKIPFQSCLDSFYTYYKSMNSLISNSLLESTDFHKLDTSSIYNSIQQNTNNNNADNNNNNNNNITGYTSWRSFLHVDIIHRNGIDRLNIRNNQKFKLISSSLCKAIKY